MSNSPNPPLHLFQVLEEEYLSLHGDLSTEELITLHGRHNIVAMLDWDFHPGHIKAAGKLAVKLRSNDDFIRHLHRVSPELKKHLETYGKDQDDAHLVKAFNELLAKHIYNTEAFKYIALRDSTFKLVGLYAKSANTSLDALAHLNRLLLEEAFPNEMEAISDIRLAAIYKRLHTQRQCAISLSGGGIRSGTFALGILQKLAHYNLLKEFQYLSTVSGGGYIGSWLTAWLARHPEGLDGVTRDMKNVPPQSKIDPDPPAIRHLRQYSNFLTPKVGLLTADTWTFVAIYLRNLLLNWLVLIPLVIAVLSLPRLYVALTLAQPLPNNDFILHTRYFLLFFGGALLVLALTYLNLNRPGVSKQLIERSPFWRKRREQGSFLRWCLMPVVISAICLTTYWAWSRQYHAGERYYSRIWLFILFGAAIPFLAFISSSFVLERFKRKYLKEFTKWELITLVLLLLTGAAGGALARLATKMENIGWLVDPIVPGSLQPPWPTELYACFAVPTLLFLVLLATTLFIGLTSRSREINDEDREWWARFGAWVLIAMMAWGVFSALSIFGPLSIFYTYGKIAASAGGVSGLIALLVAQSGKTPANEEKAAEQGMLSSIFHNHILPLMALLFVLVFLVLMSLGTSGIIYGLAKAAQWLPLPFSDGLSQMAPPIDEDGHMSTIHYANAYFVASFIAGLAMIVTVLGNLINLNQFSLHAGYRNRLIRAYLGASRAQNERTPNPFTGFDPADNIQMHELRPALLHENDFTDLEGFALKLEAAADDLAAFIKKHLTTPVRERLGTYNEHTPLPTRDRIDLIEDLNGILESEEVAAETVMSQGVATIQLVKVARQPVNAGDRAIISKRAVLATAYPQHIRSKYPPPHNLLHVVNLTLNLVGGKNLAWQQRKAETFAVTPLHSGCFRLGYRKSRFYGGEDGISLGTAATVSGAAVSPNMGYYTSSPLLSFILTLFNVRLGWWLGNPGPAGEKTFHRASPRLSVAPIIQEAFGLTDDTNKYVYLSDGGHFENLAVYEMVLRRCHLIVVCDGAQDENYEFEDLGNAVRKIGIDLGVPIKFDSVPIFKKVPENEQGRHWAFGRICYTDVDGDGASDGILIYIKPALYGREPRDVLQYQKANPAFPHQSTGDQFFDEPQFESYRMLGAYIMDSMCANRLGDDDQPGNLDIRQFVEQAYTNYHKSDAPEMRPLEVNWLPSMLEADAQAALSKKLEAGTTLPNAEPPATTTEP